MEMAAREVSTMKREVTLLNLICIAVAVLFLAMATLNAWYSPQLFTTDNLFVTMVCLVMALMFGVIPIAYLHSEGKLPIPFQKRLARRSAAAQIPASKPPLLDAKGRAVPPDVRSMVANMKQKEQ